MSDRLPVGDLADALGVRITRCDGDLPSDAIVILRVRTADGGTALRVGWSDGMDWIVRLGMLRGALLADERESIYNPDEE